MSARAPALVRITDLASLLGVSPYMIRSWVRKLQLRVLRPSVPGKRVVRGPWYLSMQDAADVALRVLGRRVDEALLDALQRRAGHRVDALGGYRTQLGTLPC